MTDRKTVMSWLEGLTWDDWHEYHSDSEVQNIAKATLELLKEQEPVVRCKDCKYYAVENYGSFCGYQVLAASDVSTCHRWGDDVCMVTPDGYCFLAERR